VYPSKVLKSSLKFFSKILKCRPMSSGINYLYEFGEFRMDPQNEPSRRQRELVPLTPKAF